ncbi:TIGR03960 family B12-binding radical SAM protein [Clostridia bacterium OttesenSCG-928-F22]|nr:TIGR03960 family B12-binding radical SAM protein [Clostridia bacterium OttesenSCG-928-F22]
MLEIEKALEEILPKVEKPARYTGNELNSVVKRDVDIRFAFAFPDVYEVGMSHLGLRILYDTINKRQDSCCERVFAPWIDMEEQMRKHDIPLFTLETKTPVSQFDLLGFTLQYEMSYTNILNMMALAGIPMHTSERTQGPFIIVGGPCAYNPEPIAPFVDIVLLGDGEEAIHQVLDAYAAWKKRGAPRQAFLEDIASIKGVYIPSFYEATYHNGKFAGLTPLSEAAPAFIEKAIVKDLQNVSLEHMLVPYLQTVHDRIMLEVFRGCTRGCRFCQAGYVYRPVRERGVDTLLQTAKCLVAQTGYEEISLSSLSTGDYSKLDTLLQALIDEFSSKKVALSLPSLRIDSFMRGYLEKIGQVRKTGLTFAPEAGSQRLRDVINKGVTEQDLLSCAKDAFEMGYSTIKLYFMIGLPTETYEDLDGIVDLARKVGDVYYSIPKDKRKKGLRITISTSSFVPKPHTPFQWCAQDSYESIQEKQRYLSAQLRTLRYVKYNYHDAALSIMEAAFARGDRRMANVLLLAHTLGCKFDGWQDQFKLDCWKEAFELSGTSPGDTCGSIALDAPLAWGHLHCGVSMDYLKREYDNALHAQTTPDCRQGCQACGLTDCDGVAAL